MTETVEFPLAVVANVCDGPAALRDRLLDRGLDLPTIARLVHCSPRTLTRATKGGSSPRGVLVGLATLVAVLDRLDDFGVRLDDLARGLEPGSETAGAVDALAAESPLAARMLGRVGEAPVTQDGGQMTLRVPRRRAA